MSPKKRMPKNTKKMHRKKRKVFPLFGRSLLFIVSAVILYSLTVSLLSPHKILACANSLTCKSDLSVQIDNNAVGMFDGQRVIPPHMSLAEAMPDKDVLGASTAPGAKHIFVDIAAQTLYAYQGQTLVFKTLVSTGKWDPTPTGNFYIWEKLVSTTMAGGSGDDAYNLPNVPYVMYFYQDYGLHGAYWHDNFGHPMSHGCVNLRQVDAKTLYDWADGPSGNTQGTEVSICDQIQSDGTCIQNNPVQQ
jgi:hypothetical protein